MSLNFRLATLISFINTAYRNRLVYLEITYCNLYLRILYVLYKYRIIGYFNVRGDKIRIRFLYNLGRAPFKTLKVVSTPGNRKFLSLSKLSLLDSRSSFAGFMLISTSKGYLTNAECLTIEKVSGEVLLLVSY